MIHRCLLAFIALATAVPAAAGGSIPVPEGSNFALFGIGLAGVLIGRRASMRK